MVCISRGTVYTKKVSFNYSTLRAWSPRRPFSVLPKSETWEGLTCDQAFLFLPVREGLERKSKLISSSSRTGGKRKAWAQVSELALEMKLHLDVHWIYIVAMATNADELKWRQIRISAVSCSTGLSNTRMRSGSANLKTYLAKGLLGNDVISVEHGREARVVADEIPLVRVHVYWRRAEARCVWEKRSWPGNAST